MRSMPTHGGEAMLVWTDGAEQAAVHKSQDSCEMSGVGMHKANRP
jgi:hypothetical protein